MNRLPLIKIITLLCLCLPVLANAQQSQNVITLNLPESVIAEAIQATLPLNIETDSDSVNGTITIAEINNLALDKDFISCDLHLLGHDIQLATKIAGHTIRLKVGEVEINFRSDITIRFERASQKLFIKPIIKEIGSSADQAGGDIGRTLIALLSGKEFPVSLDKIDPLIVQTGTKDIFIAMEKIDISLRKDALLIYFAPKVSTKTKATK